MDSKIWITLFGVAFKRILAPIILNNLGFKIIETKSRFYIEHKE